MLKHLHTLTVILTTCVLCACGGTGDKVDDSQKNDSLTIHIALQPTASNLPFYYAQQAGIFDTLGVRVQLHTFRAAMNCDTAFIGYTAQAIVSDNVKAVLWSDNGDSVSIVMATTEPLFLMAAQSARLTQQSSIKEKVIAMTRNSQIDMLLDRFATAKGLEPTDINRPQINNVFLRSTMLQQNQYDAAVLPEPFASDCEALGATRLADATALTGCYESALIFKSHVAKKRHEDIDRIIQSYNIAVERINSIIASNDSLLAEIGTMQEDTLRDNSSTIKQLQSKYVNLSEFYPAKFRLTIPDSLVRYKTIARGQRTQVQSVREAADWAATRQLLKNAVKPEELIDSTFTYNTK